MWERDGTVFAHESFVLAWFLRISKHNVWVSQSIFLWGPKTQTYRAHRLLYGKVGHSSHAHIFKLTRHSILNTLRVWSESKPCLQMERERERERERCRHVKVNIASADQQVERERERERDVCVCSFWISSVCVFTLETRLRISKFCVDLCKKNLIIRDV